MVTSPEKTLRNHNIVSFKFLCISILNIKREIVPVRVGFINLPHTFIEDHYGNYFEE